MPTLHSKCFIQSLKKSTSPLSEFLAHVVNLEEVVIMSEAIKGRASIASSTHHAASIRSLKDGIKVTRK